MKEHKSPQLGTMATPCDNCGLEFVYQVDHCGWEGLPCVTFGYNNQEKWDIAREYRRITDVYFSQREALVA